MSLYGAEFLRTLKKRFGADAEVNFTPHGYLVLASKQSADELIDNSKMQNEIGAVNMILGKKGLKERYVFLVEYVLRFTFHPFYAQISLVECF